MRDPGSVSYDAAVESAASRDTDPQPSPFAQRAYREAQRRGFDAADRRVVLDRGGRRGRRDARLVRPKRAPRGV